MERPAHRGPQGIRQSPLPPLDRLHRRRGSRPLRTLGERVKLRLGLGSPQRRRALVPLFGGALVLPSLLRLDLGVVRTLGLVAVPLRALVSEFKFRLGLAPRARLQFQFLVAGAGGVLQRADLGVLDPPGPARLLQRSALPLPPRYLRSPARPVAGAAQPGARGPFQPERARRRPHRQARAFQKRELERRHPLEQHRPPVAGGDAEGQDRRAPDARQLPPGPGAGVLASRKPAGTPGGRAQRTAARRA